MEFDRGPEVGGLHIIRDSVLQLYPGYCSVGEYNHLQYDTL